MPRNKKNFQPKVNECIKVTVEITLKKFLESDDLKEWEYPSSLTAEERAYVHMEAKKYFLKSKSRGKGSSRYLTVYKREGSAIMQKDASINLTPTSRTALSSLLSKFPVSTRERQDCLPPVERCKDAHLEGKENSRALGRLTGANAQVPTPSCNKGLVAFRQSLPIYAFMDSIVQTINESQVTIISGPTGSGKSTQVPQYLVEWHEKIGRPCRILVSEPRRISTVSVSERVALERGEKLGQSVGYQIRLEGKVSSSTVLMYCTSGVLLRSLMANEGMLSTVTHVIIDEVHERDRLSDFMLIVLREALSKYRNLRLILMSATLDAKQYSVYFNNCPVISVPGKQFDVKEYFLEDVLEQTGYMSSEMGKMRNMLKVRKAQAAALEKWTSAVHEGVDALSVNDSVKTSTTSSSNDMNAALTEAWTCGSEQSFARLMHLINSKNISVDYQHTETGVTALMVAAARGSLDTVEQLLYLGANINLRASNDFRALNWAEQFSRTEIAETLMAYESNFEQNATAPSSNDTKGPSTSSKVLSESEKELLELYHTSFSDSKIDFNLIVSLIALIQNDVTNRGAVLVFLPGYEDIILLKEQLIHESNKLNQKTKMVLLVLHSNMQTSDQKLVFKPAPPNSRKVILSTNIAETGLTIEDVCFVIDSGKVKEKTYYAFSGVSQLSTVWISKSCAVQRKGRAGRVQTGVCYRLYSSMRFEAMSNYPTPEIQRTPLQELCLFAKQLAPPNTSIVDFLSRALDPPPSSVSRTAVSLLKTIDALDTWEDLTDLGHHLVDLPVEPRYGKMLIYSLVLKCLDPILTIVCCLSYKDLFTIPVSVGDKRKVASAERAKFAGGSLSDHMVLLRVFQNWQEAKKQGREKQFCAQNFVNSATMEIVMGTRAQVLAQLRASGFIKAKGPLDIRYVNVNSDNWAVVKCALMGGLYPNIARVDREHGVLRTVKEHKVKVHMSSVLTENKTKKSCIETLPTDWIMFEELMKIGSHSCIRTATVVSPFTVAVFAGPSKIPLDALSDTHLEGVVGSDSEEEENGPELTATLKVDDWATFRTDSETAQATLQLRVKWQSLLLRKLRSNRILNFSEESVINTIVRVVTAEELALGLNQPSGIGKRPYPMTPDMQAGADRFGGNKMFDEIVAPSVPMPVSGSSPFRYFIIKAGQLRNIELSIIHRAWGFLSSTQARIVQAFKGGKTVILIFSIQGSGHFQGYARLVSDTPVVPEMKVPDMAGHQLNAPLPVEWIKRANIPHFVTKHLHNPYNDNAMVQMSRDGQELEPTVGEALCLLWDTPIASGSHLPRNPRFNRPSSFNNY